MTNLTLTKMTLTKMTHLQYAYIHISPVREKIVIHNSHILNALQQHRALYCLTSHSTNEQPIIFCITFAEDKLHLSNKNK